MCSACGSADRVHGRALGRREALKLGFGLMGGIYRLQTGQVELLASGARAL